MVFSFNNIQKISQTKFRNLSSNLYRSLKKEAAQTTAQLLMYLMGIAYFNRPRLRSNASGLGSLPLKFIYSFIGSSLPPISRTFSLNALAVS